MADIPEYAFNEYLEIINDIGVILFLCGITIIFLIIQRQDRIVKYALITILFLSLSSYPLHIIPIQILFVILLSQHHPIKSKIKFHINIKFILIIIFYTYVFINSQIYLKKISCTEMWKKQKDMANVSFIEVRDIEDYKKFFLYIADNPDYLLDYGDFLYRQTKYQESIKVLVHGARISNDPVFLIIIGMNYEKLENYVAAEYFYLKAARRVPNRLSPLYRLALLYYKIKDYDKFTSMSQTVLSFDPKIESEIIKNMKNEILYIVAKEKTDGLKSEEGY